MTEAGTSTLAFDGGPSTPLSLLYSIIAWLAAVAVVAAPRPRGIVAPGPDRPPPAAGGGADGADGDESTAAARRR